MWKLSDVTAQRFPLVARPRPACLPLGRRVKALVDLADAAQRQSDLSVASTVCNQAALIASDTGDADTARTMCRQHTIAYLHGAPLSARDAVRALEPVVNLVRLQLRDGHSHVGHRQFQVLFDSITAGRAATIEGITVPYNLVATDEARRDVRTWLWTVLLADGTRALTSAGRWKDALSHIQRHRGLAQRMLDGRQVAVVAALASADTAHAKYLLTNTVPGEPWEAAVTDALTVLCLRVAGQPYWRPLQNLVAAYLELPSPEGLVSFHTRLGLVVLDLVDSPTAPAARQIVACLCRRAIEAADGYAARDALAYPLTKKLASGDEVKECQRLLSSCALQAGALPDNAGAQVGEAVGKSTRVILETIGRPITLRAEGAGRLFPPG
ncbi:hypothetical protein OG824_28180 [Streptomyces prunicolor]|uniref:hypothetical protein n=1 Tax=Streptomyces prunicolor TaxID=67348 RepID=UPI002251622C|nr:hypothetical protein [Streptomyces prunicolor]MCX5239083.1 hypothetical protein [Streptomyces prunicolor]